MDGKYESIRCLTEIVTIDPKRCLGGIPIERTRRLSVAHQIYKSCPIASRLPGGKYFLTAHDQEVALLEQIRFGERFSPHISWIAETKRLLPSVPEIYSDRLPIVVEQDLSRLCIHHNAPAYGCKLWRYMDLRKLKRMLEEGGIFLARADRFPDDREGTLAFANSRYRSQVYTKDPRMAAGYSEYCDELRNIKHHTYIGCWRVDETEDLRSWSEYTRSGEGVAVQTTYYKLWKRTPAIFCASVEYIDYEQTWVVENNCVSPFFYKSKSEFGWEREFRIILQQFPRTEWVFGDSPYFDCSEEDTNDARILLVDPKWFVDRIVTHPGASNGFVTDVINFVQKYGLAEAVTRSALPL
jgi:hypothetical protein